MSDPRLTPANAHVAAAHLEGLVSAPRYVEGELREITVPVADIWDETGAHRQRQLLRGDRVRVYDLRDRMNFVQAERDGYVGYVDAAQIGAPSQPLHMVAVPATHVYAQANVTCGQVTWHSFGSRLQVVGDEAEFFRLHDGGFVPKVHLRPLNKPFQDPVVVAQMLFGVPYLWGGNSTLGIDCSGLVQAALLASGRMCPADSDLQRLALGKELPQDATPQRGDLYFWPKHVAMVVDEKTFIHANGYHYGVAYEPIEDMIARMDMQGDGPVIARKRL